MNMIERFVHYSDQELTELRLAVQAPVLAMKPMGLWLSVVTADGDGWRDWCLAERFCLHKLAIGSEIAFRRLGLHLGSSRHRSRPRRRRGAPQTHRRRLRSGLTGCPGGRAARRARCSQSRCATRLRYAPDSEKLRIFRAWRKRADIASAGAAPNMGTDGKDLACTWPRNAPLGRAGVRVAFR